MSITRRHVLAAMAAVAATGTTTAGGVAWQWWNRAPGEGLKALSQHEYDIVQAMAEGWMPRGGTPALSGADANLGAYLDSVLADMAPLDRKGLKLLIQAVDDLCLVSDGGTFRSLSVDRRSELVQFWLSSEINLVRSAFTALFILMSIGWTSHPDVAAHLSPMFPCGNGA